MCAFLIAGSMSRFCLCFRPPAQEVRILDYHHTSLSTLPNEVFAWERTLEELYVDSNQIKDLPRVGTGEADEGEAQTRNRSYFYFVDEVLIETQYIPIELEIMI